MYYKNIVVSIIILYIAYPLYPNKIEEILHTSIFNEATITNTFSSEYEFYTTFGEDEILVFGNYKEIVLWDVHDNNEIMKLEGSFRGKSPRGSYIVISKDNKKILWDTEQKKTHLEVSGSLLGFSSDETYFILEYQDRINVKQTSNAKTVYSISKETDKGDIRFLSFNRDNTQIVVYEQQYDENDCSMDMVANTFYTIDIEAGKIISESKKILSPIVAVSKNGDYVVVDKTFHICECMCYQLYDIRTSELLESFELPIFSRLSFSDDSKILFTPDFDYDIESRKKYTKTVLIKTSASNMFVSILENVSHNSIYSLIPYKMSDREVLLFKGKGSLQARLLKFKLPFNFDISFNGKLGFSNKDNFLVISHSNYQRGSKVYIVDLNKIQALVENSVTLYLLPYLFIIVTGIFFAVIIILLILCIKKILKKWKPTTGFSLHQKIVISIYLINSFLFSAIGFLCLLQFNFYYIPVYEVSGMLFLASPFFIIIGFGLFFLKDNFRKTAGSFCYFIAVIGGFIAISGVQFEYDYSKKWISGGHPITGLSGDVDIPLLLIGVGICVYFAVISTQFKKFEFTE